MKRKPKLNHRVVTKLVGSLIIEGDGWERFIKREQLPYEITGKYLFFSPDRNQLVEIAIDELEHGGFHEAKIPLVETNDGPDYVLCLYYKDASRKHELANTYRNRPGVDYRYWKSDEATEHGEYSAKFRQQRSPDPHELPPELSEEELEEWIDVLGERDFQILQQLEQSGLGY